MQLAALAALIIILSGKIKYSESSMQLQFTSRDDYSKKVQNSVLFLNKLQKKKKKKITTFHYGVASS